MIFKIEVLAIYEESGTTPTGTRITQRDSDYSQADSLLNNANHYLVEGQRDPEEQLLKFEAGSKYGFGWTCSQFLNVRQDGDDIGRTVANRLATRGMKAGSHVQVYEHLRDEGNPWATGAIIFEQLW
jgi:hypothetical protein